MLLSLQGLTGCVSSVVCGVQLTDVLSQIAVWLARGSFPHAIESTAAVLHAILLDSSPSESSSKAARSHPARLTYAMALVRFVNSIVDPLQTAYFARPIAALAASVDLPLSFVELRHRATHEHLPSLAVLRDAARQAMDWLYTHYWLPLVAQGALDAAVVQGDEVARDATVLREQLGAYKALAKRLQRDASLVASHKDKRDKAMRTVVDAALALTAAPGDSVPVIDILLEPGMLVPLAKSKRPSSSRNKGKGKASTEPGLVSPELVEVWSPLLARLDDAVATPEQEDEDVPSFIDALVDRLASILCSAPDPQDDKSYFHTLAAWLVHFCCPTDGDDELALQVARACFESLNARCVSKGALRESGWAYQACAGRGTSSSCSPRSDPRSSQPSTSSWASHATQKLLSYVSHNLQAQCIG